MKRRLVRITWVRRNAAAPRSGAYPPDVSIINRRESRRTSSRRDGRLRRQWTTLSTRSRSASARCGTFRSPFRSTALVPPRIGARSRRRPPDRCRRMGVSPVSQRYRTRESAPDPRSPSQQHRRRAGRAHGGDAEAQARSGAGDGQELPAQQIHPIPASRGFHASWVLFDVSCREDSPPSVAQYAASASYIRSGPASRQQRQSRAPGWCPSMRGGTALREESTNVLFELSDREV